MLVVDDCGSDSGNGWKLVQGEGCNQGNHMATVTWRASRLAVWFSWKR